MSNINEIEFLYAYLLKICSHFTLLMHSNSFQSIDLIFLCTIVVPLLTHLPDVEGCAHHFEENFEMLAILYQSAKPNHESTTPKTFSFQIFELPEPTEAPEFAPEPAPAVDPVAPKTPPTPKKDLFGLDLRANGFDLPPGVDLSSLNLDSYDDVDLESLQDYG